MTANDFLGLGGGGGVTAECGPWTARSNRLSNKHEILPSFRLHVIEKTLYSADLISVQREAESLVLGQDADEELGHGAGSGGGVANSPESHRGVVANILQHHLLAAGVPPQVLRHVVYLNVE
jgi:hypothetical protein